MLSTRWIVAVTLIAISSLSMTFPAQAELKIDITRGTVEPMPIAITDFVGDNAV